METSWFMAVFQLAKYTENEGKLQYKPVKYKYVHLSENLGQRKILPESRISL